MNARGVVTMDDGQALLLYEKLYFHELDCREKLTARLQLSFGILSAIILMVSYVVAHTSLAADPSASAWALFLISMAASVVLAILAATSYVKALWGHSY